MAIQVVTEETETAEVVLQVGSKVEVGTAEEVTEVALARANLVAGLEVLVKGVARVAVARVAA